MTFNAAHNAGCSGVLQETIPDQSMEPNRQAHTHSKESCIDVDKSCLLNQRPHRTSNRHRMTPISDFDHDRHDRKSNPVAQETQAL
jgi:hypothetical protein